MPNAGDRFAVEAAQRLFPGPVEVSDERPLPHPNLLLLGSLLEWADAMTHVCGVGFISATSRLSVTPRFIASVRGPLTRDRLAAQRMPVPDYVGDPGVLAPRWYPRMKAPSGSIGIIPHYVDRHMPWIEQCRRAGFRMIDPDLPLTDYFQQLGDCQVILSSSLHGLIFAHAYGLPALWIEVSDGVLGEGFKFYDYYASLGQNRATVARVRVREGVDPESLISRACVADVASLVAAVDASVAATRVKLIEDEEAGRS
jgi:pyruvyltransferase